jgi:hypothetical protein
LLFALLDAGELSYPADDRGWIVADPIAVDRDGRGAGYAAPDCVDLHPLQAVQVPFAIDALCEFVGVETEFAGVFQRAITGVADGVAGHVFVVEVPPVTLVSGAFGGQGGELGLGAEDDEVAVFELGQPGVYEFFD